MTFDEITYLLDSFNEAIKINAEFLELHLHEPMHLYKIEVNLLPKKFDKDKIISYAYRVELFMTIGGNQMLEEGLKEYRKNIGSYALEGYELKDFFATADRVVNSFDKSKWFSNWKKSIEREYKLKKIGI